MPLVNVGTHTTVSLLAHQGGWDEILMVVGPLAVVGLLLWMANKRVEAQLEAAEDRVGEGDPPHTTSDVERLNP